MGTRTAQKWSYYLAYAGDAPAPAWLTTEVLTALGGGRSRRERQAAMRAYCDEAIREGLSESPWERLVGGAVLGSEDFVASLRGLMKGNRREQQSLRQLVNDTRYVAVNARPAEKLPVSAAARLVGMSAPQFMKTFKQVAGMTLVAYLNHVRLANGARLLRETDRSIADIADASGFSDQC